MEGDMRREQIVAMLKQSREPISGSLLARKMGVSRQIIVQDIALLRAVNKNILSTNKGYLLYDPLGEETKLRETIAVCHTDEQTEDELNTIVDCGGKVLDVVVEHDIYGQITVDLILKNRQDVQEFIQKMELSKSKPLKTLTDNRHFHTVEAEDAATLERIEAQLRQKGYVQ